MFEAKIRKVGTSFGLLIPAESVSKNKLKEGSKIRVAILRENTKMAEELFGSVKARPFIRREKDRVI